MRTSIALITFTLLLPLSPGGALAGEWQGWRGGTGRTALASGKSDIHKPAVRWRYFLGGALGSSGFIALDADSDKKRELLYLSGGRLVAKEADDTLMWETAILRLTRIKGAFDLNGDGKEEVVVEGKAGQVFVFSPADGSLCWSLPTGKVAKVGTVLVTDLDGDGKNLPELYIAEHATNGPQGSAHAYGFSGSCGGGKKLTPKLLWTMKYTGNSNPAANRGGSGGLWDVAADLNGDKLPEIVATAAEEVHVYDGKTGKHLSVTKLGAELIGGAWVMAADVDGDKQAELLFATNRAGTQRVWLMASGAGQTTLKTVWVRKAANEGSDLHTITHDPMHDLDGDGKQEILTSFKESGSWATQILDSASSGTAKVMASVPGEYLVGAADLDGDGRAEVITSKPDAAEVRVRSWNKTSKKLDKVRSVAAPAGGTVLLLKQLDRARWAVQGPATRAVAWDADLKAGKGKELLLLLSDKSGQTLDAYDMSGATASKRASHVPGAGVTLLSALPTSDVGEEGGGGQLLTPRSDGYLVSLGSGLVPTNSQVYGEFKRTGARIGGFMNAATVVADMDGDGKPEVLARDSRGMVLCLDPAGANLVKPPTLRWATPAPSSLRPAVADLDGDGKRELLLDARPQTEIVVYRSDGKKWWGFPADPTTWKDRTLVGSLLWGDVNGDKVLDVIYVAYSTTDKKRYVGALHGKTGKPVWASKEVGHLAGGCGLGIHTLKDLDGDGLLDVVFAACKTILGIRGKDGKVLNPQNIQAAATDKTGNNCGNTSGYAMVHDLDGDKSTDLLATGNYAFMCAFKPALSAGTLTLNKSWTSTPAVAYNPVYAAPAPCTGGVRLAAPVKASNKVEVRAGKDGALLTTLALKAGTLTGDLTHAATHADLAGSGSPRTLLGSDDGYLYAVDPCAATPKLDWSLYMRAPVGEAVFGDTDGDKKDEILVGSQDGYLFALGREHLPAPAHVYENDGTGPVTSAAKDLDAIEHHDTLYGNWAKVAEADAYEYAVITSYGSIITKPSFVKVGDKTSATATGLKLKLGQRYFFAVRAVNTKSGKTSGEALSDGVLVVDNAPPTIKLEAAPNPFDPGGEKFCGIQATFLDGHQLASYRVWITDAGGQTVKDWGKIPATAYKASPTFSWDGKVNGQIKLGSYTVKAEALDTRSHKTSGSLTLSLVSKDGGLSMGDGGVDPGDGDPDGCECTAGSGASSVGLFWLLVLAVVLLRQRRRQKM